MRHWLAPVAASIVGLFMAILVVVVSFRVAGDGPATSFNHPAATVVAVH